jgi:hypothetical protein
MERSGDSQPCSGVPRLRRSENRKGKQLPGVPQGEVTAVVAPVQIALRTSDPREQAIMQRVLANGAEYVARYLDRNFKNGVWSIASDAVKELFPEFVQDPTGHNALVSRAAIAIADAARKTVLSMSIRDGKDAVRINVASPGSGKTTSLAQPGDERVGINIESIWSTPDLAQELLQEVIDSAAGRLRPGSTSTTSTRRSNACCLGR